MRITWISCFNVPSPGRLPTVAHKCHSKTKYFTAKLNTSRQTKNLTAKAKFSRQKHNKTSVSVDKLFLLRCLLLSQSSSTSVFVVINFRPSSQTCLRRSRLQKFANIFKFFLHLALSRKISLPKHFTDDDIFRRS